MKPLEFKEQNVTFAKNQPQYKPLPAYKDKNDPAGKVVFCMGLTLKERLRVLFNGEIWVSLMMFNQPLTPSFLSTKKSDVLPIE
jgi:hypothetical protein